MRSKNILITLLLSFSILGPTTRINFTLAQLLGNNYVQTTTYPVGTTNTNYYGTTGSTPQYNTRTSYSTGGSTLQGSAPYTTQGTMPVSYGATTNSYGSTEAYSQSAVGTVYPTGSTGMTDAPGSTGPFYTETSSGGMGSSFSEMATTVRPEGSTRNYQTGSTVGVGMTTQTQFGSAFASETTNSLVGTTNRGSITNSRSGTTANGMTSIADETTQFEQGDPYYPTTQANFVSTSEAIMSTGFTSGQTSNPGLFTTTDFFTSNGLGTTAPLEFLDEKKKEDTTFGLPIPDTTASLIPEEDTTFRGAPKFPSLTTNLNPNSEEPVTSDYSDETSTQGFGRETTTDQFGRPIDITTIQNNIQTSTNNDFTYPNSFGIPDSSTTNNNIFNTNQNGRDVFETSTNLDITESNSNIFRVSPTPNFMEPKIDTSSIESSTSGRGQGTATIGDASTSLNAFGSTSSNSTSGRDVTTGLGFRPGSGSSTVPNSLFGSTQTKPVDFQFTQVLSDGKIIKKKSKFLLMPPPPPLPPPPMPIDIGNILAVSKIFLEKQKKDQQRENQDRDVTTVPLNTVPLKGNTLTLPPFPPPPPPPPPPSPTMAAFATLLSKCKENFDYSPKCKDINPALLAEVETTASSVEDTTNVTGENNTTNSGDGVTDTTDVGGSSSNTTTSGNDTTNNTTNGNNTDAGGTILVTTPPMITPPKFPDPTADTNTPNITGTTSTLTLRPTATSSTNIDDVTRSDLDTSTKPPDKTGEVVTNASDVNESGATKQDITETVTVSTTSSPNTGTVSQNTGKTSSPEIATTRANVDSSMSTVTSNMSSTTQSSQETTLTETTKVSSNETSITNIDQNLPGIDQTTTSIPNVTDLFFYNVTNNNDRFTSNGTYGTSGTEATSFVMTTITTSEVTNVKSQVTSSSQGSALGTTVATLRDDNANDDANFTTISSIRDEATTLKPEIDETTSSKGPNYPMTSTKIVSDETSRPEFDQPTTQGNQPRPTVTNPPTTQTISESADSLGSRESTLPETFSTRVEFDFGSQSEGVKIMSSTEGEYEHTTTRARTQTKGVEEGHENGLIEELFTTTTKQPAITKNLWTILFNNQQTFSDDDLAQFHGTESWLGILNDLNITGVKTTADPKLEHHFTTKDVDYLETLHEDHFLQSQAVTESVSELEMTTERMMTRAWQTFAFPDFDDLLPTEPTFFTTRGELTTDRKSIPTTSTTTETSIASEDPKYITITATISNLDQATIDSYLDGSTKASDFENELETIAALENVLDDLMTDDAYYQQIDEDKVLLHFSIRDDNTTDLENAKIGLKDTEITREDSDPQDPVILNGLKFDTTRELHGKISLNNPDTKPFPLDEIVQLTNSVVTILEEDPDGEIITFSMISEANDPITEDKIQSILEKNLNGEDYNIIDVWVPPWTKDEATTQPDPSPDTTPVTKSTSDQPKLEKYYVGRFHINGMSDQTLRDMYDNVDNSRVGTVLQTDLSKIDIEYYEFKDDGELYGHFVTRNPFQNDPRLVDMYDNFPTHPDIDRFQPIDIKNQREFIGEYDIPGLSENQTTTDDTSPNIDQKDLKERLENYFNNDIKVVFIRDNNQQCSYVGGDNDNYFCLKLDGTGPGSEQFTKGEQIEFGIITQPNEHLTHHMLNDAVKQENVVGVLSKVRPYGPTDGKLVTGYTTVSVVDGDLASNNPIVVEVGVKNSILKALEKAKLPASFKSKGLEYHPEKDKYADDTSVDKQKYKHRYNFEIRLPPARKLPKNISTDRLKDFKEKANEEEPTIPGNTNANSPVFFISDGLFFDKHNPCDSPYANVCDLLANCQADQDWDGYDVNQAKFTCTCQEGYVEKYDGRTCIDKSEIQEGMDGPLVGMVVTIVILFIVILILSYFVHKKRTRQKNYNPRAAEG